MSMQYKIDVFDERSKTFILRNIDADLRGVKVVLKQLTHMKADEVVQFVETLWENNHHRHQGEKRLSKHYSISVRKAVKRTRVIEKVGA